MKSYMYILECSDGSYYIGSTIDLDKRLKEHSDGRGANHTKKRLPVKLVYAEEYDRIDKAFYRENKYRGGEEKRRRHLLEAIWVN
jgi:putative endonuclease